MDLGLRDRNAIVSGSSRGIGLAIAEQLLHEGCRVAITGRASETLAHAHAELVARFGADPVIAFSGDLTTREVIRHLRDTVERAWGQVDILVANIGTGAGVRGVDAGDEEWSRLLTANLLAPTRIVSELVPDMARRRNGAIVLIGSITGVEATPAPLAYSASKAALISFTKNVSREVGPFGVRVNCVAPGNILFEGGSWERRTRAEPDQTARYIAAEVPLQRFGTVSEIANVVAFLCSERASFVTGTCIVVDGGQTRSA